jgi:hypothetical protein
MKAVPYLLGFCAAAALAQFGGPFPGGGQPFPGGGVPGGRRPQQQQPPPVQDKGKRTDSRKTPIAGATTEGRVRRATASQLVIEPDDHRIIWYRVGTGTVVHKDGKDTSSVTSFAPGDRVTVDSTEDDQGFFSAIDVTWQSAGSASERAAASQTWDLPGAASAAPAASSSGSSNIQRDPGDERPVLRRKTPDAEPAPEPAAERAPEPARAAAPAPAPQQPVEEAIDNRPTTEIRQPDTVNDADDPGRPKLRRGAQPAPRQTAATPSAPQPAQQTSAAVPQAQLAAPQLQPAASPANQPILPQEDPLIVKARDVAASYADSLPNFFCQQLTTRYESSNPKQGWNPLDIVSADVAYQDGRESYKNIKVGNKAVNKSMEEIGGTRSTGEFSTLQEAILRPGVGATFKRNGEDRIRSRQAVVFKFEIPRDRSGWRIEQVSQLYYPAYRGSIWVDKETSRILRIEQEARGMPSLFPLDTVESSTDYDFVRLAVGAEFLLPVEAEVLSCQRGTSNCSRNKIEFRNYRKFGAESEITFGDPK